jgi:fucose permease
MLHQASIHFSETEEARR